MSELEDAENPLSVENAPGVSLIVQLRIYDVLMALLTHHDEAAAARLLEMHSQGVIFGPSPHLNGVFVTDEVNENGETPAG